MKIKVVIICVIYGLIFYACSDDEQQPLPQELEIDILNVNLAEGEIKLRGTELLSGQTGKWKTLSTNQTTAVFSDELSSNSVLKGNIYEEYRIEWSISNNSSKIAHNILHRMSAGYSLKELLEADRDIKALLNFYTPNELFSEGVTLQEFIDSNISFKELIVSLKDSKITTLDFIQLGYNTERLKQEGLILETSKTGFYIMTYLHKPILLNADKTLEIINSNLSDMKTWRIPTFDELLYIYDNKNSYDLRLDNQFLYPDNPVVEHSETANDVNEWLSSTKKGDCVISGTSGETKDLMKTLNLKTGSHEEVCLTYYFCDCIKFTYLIPVIQL